MSVTQGSRCSYSRSIWLAVAAAGLAAGSARADDDAPPSSGGAPPASYVVALVNTTVAHRPAGGSFDGWGHDINPAIGFGRMVGDTVAIELD